MLLPAAQARVAGALPAAVRYARLAKTIRGRTHAEGSIHARVQERLRAVFGSAADALVFMAVAGGGESLSRDDLVRAFERLGITGEPSL